jgi:hypothetical protein
MKVPNLLGRRGDCAIRARHLSKQNLPWRLAVNIHGTLFSRFCFSIQSLYQIQQILNVPVKYVYSSQSGI